MDIKDLRGNGWRYIQLLPGRDHMHFTARVWFNLPGDAGRICVEQKMSKRRLYKISRSAEEDDFDALCDKLQQFIALHSYWKVATGKIFRMHVKATPAAEKHREHLERSFLVRPHYRWLPPEYHASEEAIARSLKTFKAPPPPGKTFVMSDLDKAAAPASPSAAAVDKPTIRYQDEDLGYTGE